MAPSKSSYQFGEAETPSASGDRPTASFPHFNWLKRALLSRFDRQAVDDLIQEAYLRFSAYDTDQVRHPKALLLRIAENLGKSDARRRRTARLYAEAATVSAEFSQWADQLEGLILKETITSLPEPLRDVFVLNRFHGMTYGEVAKACNLSEKTVEWRMSKALAHCAARLRD